MVLRQKLLKGQITEGTANAVVVVAFVTQVCTLFMLYKERTPNSDNTEKM